MAHSGENHAKIDTPELDDASAACRFEDRIPRHLLDRLVELRPYLERQGSVIQREEERGDVYRLRVRVDDDRLGRRHRGITIYGVRAAQAISSLIASWRTERDAEAEDKRNTAAARRRYRRTVEDARRSVLASHGGGGRRRRRISKEISAAAEDPPVLLSYLQIGTFAAPNRRPGRKPKGSLC